MSAMQSAEPHKLTCKHVHSNVTNASWVQQKLLQKPSKTIVMINTLPNTQTNLEIDGNESWPDLEGDWKELDGSCSLRDVYRSMLYT